MIIVRLIRGEINECGRLRDLSVVKCRTVAVTEMTAVTAVVTEVVTEVAEAATAAEVVMEAVVAAEVVEAEDQAVLPSSSETFPGPAPKTN